MRRTIVSESALVEALNFYNRLRQRGQNSTLARLSVEARYGDLPTEQRLWLRQALREREGHVTV